MSTSQSLNNSPDRTYQFDPPIRGTLDPATRNLSLLEHNLGLGFPLILWLLLLGYSIYLAGWVQKTAGHRKFLMKAFLTIAFSPAVLFLSPAFLGPYWLEQCHELLRTIYKLPKSGLFFTFLFAFKFIRVLVHFISYKFFYKAVDPYPNAEDRNYVPADVTIIIPTVGDFSNNVAAREFEGYLKSLLDTQPFQIIICTVGEDKARTIKGITNKMIESRGLQKNKMKVIIATDTSKRLQMVTAAKQVKSRVCAFVDDHVRWPDCFLEYALAPFEDEAVVLVGTSKRVDRIVVPDPPPSPKGQISSTVGKHYFHRFLRNYFFKLFPGNSLDILNYLACIYLERHNFECSATNAIDGGVFVVSGRTMLIKSYIFQSKDFQDSFLNEYYFGHGPMNVDDDNFITRYVVNAGLKIKFQNCAGATLETLVGMDEGGDGWNKFHLQLLRWARTGFRSNFTSLFLDRVVWTAQPWCTYGVYLTSLIHIALPYDILLFWSMWKSNPHVNLIAMLFHIPLAFGSVLLGLWNLFVIFAQALRVDYRVVNFSWWSACDDWIPRQPGKVWWANVVVLVCFVFFAKFLEPWAHWYNRGDKKYIIPGILFGWYHSLLRIYACCTQLNTDWGSRPGVK